MKISEIYSLYFADNSMDDNCFFDFYVDFSGTL